MCEAPARIIPALLCPQPPAACPPMFGYTEEQLAQFGLTIGVSAFILYMLFIVLQLARESKAGKFGTFILFVVLAFGMLGFVAKNIIAWAMGI
ncbi:MAG: hypothetical protein RL654_2772 [Pseudomonadota bacterium]